MEPTTKDRRRRPATNRRGPRPSKYVVYIVRITLATILVLQAIGAGHRHGFDIVDVTGYATGTIYPALRRLERDGYVTSRWESDRDAARDGRPVRRYYELTASGIRALESALASLTKLDARALTPRRAR